MLLYIHFISFSLGFFFFFFNDTATTEIYTLSLHDALPIPSGRAVDQDLLARLHLPRIADPVERGEPGGGNGRGLLEREVRRFPLELVLGGAHVLGQGAPVQVPNTSSPGPKRVTPVPTASTIPAMSRPGTRFLGLPNP